MQLEPSNILDFPALRDARYPIHTAAGRLEPYLRAIIEKIRPEKIILFGSFAYGQPNEHSDFDLLVIRKSFPSTKASNIEIRRALWDVPAAPESFTILSETPEGLADRLARGSFFYEEIVNKGLVLYAA
jgi:uncharacterized protein